MSALKVVLISPRNPLNIGAAARAMSNFGFSELRLVNPYQVAFREARSAVKAHAVLEQAREYLTVAEAVAVPLPDVEKVRPAVFIVADSDCPCLVQWV